MLRDIISEKVHNSTAEEYSYYIWFRPENPLTGTMEKMDILFEELRELGKCLTFPDNTDVPVLEELDPENCYFSWEVIISTDKKEEFLRELFKEISTDENLVITKLCDCNVLRDVLIKKQIIEYNKEHGKIGAAKIKEMVTGKKASPEENEAEILISDLTVHTIETTRTRIDEMLKAGKSVSVVAENVSAVDVSYLQLIYSIEKGDQPGLSFRWKNELPEDIQTLLINTGFGDVVNKSINLDKE